MEYDYRDRSLRDSKIPVISMLFSPGFMCWLFVFAVTFFLKNKEYDRILLFSMPMLLWMTVLLGPTYLVRYVLIFWFSCPVLLAMLLEKYTGFSNKAEGRVEWIK